MQIQAVPRQSVRLVLGSVRLPLTMVEHLAGHADDDAWPPSLAFDALGANVKQVIGSLVRDDVLVDEGRFEGARIAELREAARLEQEAHLRERQADERLTDQRHTAEAKRAEAERQTAARKRLAATRAKQAEAASSEKLRKDEASVRAKAAARKKELAKQQRTARSRTIAKERDALQRERAAASSKADVIGLDEKLRASKAARTSS